MKKRHLIPVKILAIALGLVFVLCSCNRSLYIDDAVFRENFISHKDLFDTFRENVDETFNNNVVALRSINVSFSPGGDSYEASCFVGEGIVPLECPLTQAQEQAISVVPEIFADITKKYDQFDVIELTLYYDGGRLTSAEMYIWFYDAHYYKGYILVVDQASMSKELIDAYVSLSDNWYLHELAYPD